VLVTNHIDSFIQKLDTFHLQTAALFSCGFEAKLYLASRSQDPVPRQVIGRLGPQKACNSPMIPRIAGGGGDPSIGTDLSGRDG